MLRVLGWRNTLPQMRIHLTVLFTMLLCVFFCHQSNLVVFTVQLFHCFHVWSSASNWLCPGGSVVNCEFPCFILHQRLILWINCLSISQTICFSWYFLDPLVYHCNEVQYQHTHQFHTWQVHLSVFLDTDVCALLVHSDVVVSLAFFSHFIFFMVIDCHLVIPFNCSWVPAKVRFIKDYIRCMVTFNVSSSIRQYFLVWRPYPMNSSFSAFCLTFFPDSIRYAGIGYTPKHSKLTKIRHLPIPFLIRCCFLWGSCSWMILHVSGGSNCFFPVTLR